MNRLETCQFKGGNVAFTTVGYGNIQKKKSLNCWMRYRMLMNQS